MNLKTAPAWYVKLPVREVHDIADKHGVDKFLLAAICRQESNSNTWAMRYEPAYKPRLDVIKFAKLNGISRATEEVAQGCSWGLCQVMGHIARSLGFQGSLTELCEPSVCLEYACKLLAQLKARFPARNDMISAYNQGSPRKDPTGKYVNQEYVDSVLLHLSQLVNSF